MMSSSPLPSFGPTCPLGGTWYACGTGTYFTGCCTRNPCQITCAQGDLYPAGFNPSYHSKFPDASCGGGVSFWTCTAGNTFMGCCKTNPCSSNSVCASGNLEPAFINREDLRSAYGASGGSSSIGSTRLTTASPSTTGRTSTLSVAASPTTSAATATGGDATANTTPKNGPPVAAIAGGAAGGVLALAAGVGLLIYYFCHAKKSRKGHEESVSRRQSNAPPIMAVDNKDDPLPAPGLPPSYTSPHPNHYYSPHGGQYQAYVPQQQTQQHQYVSEPHGLAIESQSPAPFPRKSMPGHQRNMSELSGDTAIKSELETPLGSPNGQAQFTNPMSSPQGSMQPEWHSPTSAHSGQSWDPHQSWQTQSGLNYSYEPSLGVGLYGGTENNAHGPAWRPEDNTRRYHTT